MNDANFKLNIVGTYDKTVTEGEVIAFPKAVWPDICRILETHGLKTITNATLDAGGKNLTLPADVFHAVK